MDGPDPGEHSTAICRELDWLSTQTWILRDNPETALIVGRELEDCVTHRSRVSYPGLYLVSTVWNCVWFLLDVEVRDPAVLHSRGDCLRNCPRGRRQAGCCIEARIAKIARIAGLAKPWSSGQRTDHSSNKVINHVFDAFTCCWICSNSIGCSKTKHCLNLRVYFSV
jgi:hypothetical protein